MTIIKKFETQEKKSYPKKTIIIGISLMVLVILEIWVNNTMAEFGKKLNDITSSEQSLRLENQILENQIAKESSLSNIASESAILGFSRPKDVQYIR